MRSGVSTALQQTLTSEAASVLKHSLGLARRRGHAQVTPLHVAATLLSLRSSSSFRTACLKSQQPLQSSHPLQCRALELCFNVALNRLPTTTNSPSSPYIHSSSYQPSLSNALIAALKRAQAHQRRGCIEQQQQQQQQPLLTVKVELEQLVISILDDPSVSRVMREAGFNSTAVKNHIEEYSNSSNSPSLSPPSVFYNTCSSGGGVFSSPCSPSATHDTHFFPPYTSEFNPLLYSVSPPKRYQYYPASSYDKDDVNLVLDILSRKNNKKKNTVIVGDSLSSTEGLVGEIRRRVERSEVPDELKSSHFFKFQFEPVSLRYMKRDEVEMKVLELKRKVDSVALSEGGGIFYVGDLKWTVEGGEISGYNPVDHLVSEMGKLFCDGETSNNGKVWLMATASYQTYMRCQMRQPPLEIQWGLQAVPVPSGGLGLSLHASSVLDTKMNISQNPSNLLEIKPFSNEEKQDMLKCCEECASNYEKEAQILRAGQKKNLPFWLQSHTTEGNNKDDLTELKRKWNRLCHCLHQSKQSLNHWNCSNSFNSNVNMIMYPYNSSTSISFTNNDPKPTYSYSSNLVPRFRRQQSCTIEFDFNHKRQATETFSDSVENNSKEGKEVKVTLALGNGGSGETVEKKLTDRTLQRAHVCKILQENVPWQSETIPSIAEALVDNDSKSAKQSNVTWLLLHGNDSVGKRRLALAVSESVFGSMDMFLHFDMLKKETSKSTFSEMLIEALKTHQQLVVLLENVDFADAQFKKLLSDGFETGKIGTLEKSESTRVIFILTNGGSGSTSTEEQSQDSVFRLFWQVSESKSNLDEPCFGLKRKAELDLFSNVKSLRIEEKKDQDEFLVSKEETKRKDFSRNSSFNNTLDLNMKADEEDDGENSSPNSSDLTRETIVDNGFFLDSIENRFEFNTNPAARDREIAEEFLSKIKGSFEEVCGKQNKVKLDLHEKVVENICVGCGCFTNSMFEKWLKDIFQTSLETVNFGGKEGIRCFRLCWDGKGNDRKWDSGFMGSSLPRSIQVNFFIE